MFSIEAYEFHTCSYKKTNDNLKKFAKYMF